MYLCIYSTTECVVDVGRIIVSLGVRSKAKCNVGARHRISRRNCFEKRSRESRQKWESIDDSYKIFCLRYNKSVSCCTCACVWQATHVSAACHTCQSRASWVLSWRRLRGNRHVTTTNWQPHTGVSVPAAFTQPNSVKFIKSTNNLLVYCRSCAKIEPFQVTSCDLIFMCIASFIGRSFNLHSQPHSYVQTEGASWWWPHIIIAHTTRLAAAKTCKSLLYAHFTRNALLCLYIRLWCNSPLSTNLGESWRVLSSKIFNVVARYWRI